MSLNHSNIVQVLDLGESEGRYFLALELVDGWTLDRILKRSKAAGVPIRRRSRSTSPRKSVVRSATRTPRSAATASRSASSTATSARTT